MKLDDLNVNTVELGHNRTVGYDYEMNVPTFYKQREDIELENENTEEEVDIKSDISKLIDIILMSNSWSPSRDAPDIRKVPNTSNLQ